LCEVTELLPKTRVLNSSKKRRNNVMNPRGEMNVRGKLML